MSVMQVSAGEECDCGSDWACLLARACCTPNTHPAGGCSTRWVQEGLLAGVCYANIFAGRIAEDIRTVCAGVELSVLFDTLSFIDHQRRCAFRLMLIIDSSIKILKHMISALYFCIKFDLVQILMTFLTCASPTKRVKCTI